jgi:outer membrane protein OmpA-like peptidoglycan-associated protein
MEKYPTVKFVVIGHTDDREALPKGRPNPDGDPTESDGAAETLSLERAGVVRAALIALGIPEGRIDVVGKGADDPVGDNDKKRGRLANRRVEIKRFVPKI